MLLTSDLDSSHFEMQTAPLEKPPHRRHTDDFAEAFGTFLQAFTPELPWIKENAKYHVNDKKDNADGAELQANDNKNSDKGTKLQANDNQTSDRDYTPEKVTKDNLHAREDTKTVVAEPKTLEGERDVTKTTSQNTAKDIRDGGHAEKSTILQARHRAVKNNSTQQLSAPHKKAKTADLVKFDLKSVPEDSTQDTRDTDTPQPSRLTPETHAKRNTPFEEEPSVLNSRTAIEEWASSKARPNASTSDTFEKERADRMLHTSSEHATAQVANTHARQFFSDTQLEAMARALSPGYTRDATPHDVMPPTEPSGGDSNTSNDDISEHAWTEETHLLPNASVAETAASVPTKASPRLLTQQITSALMAVRTADDGTKTQTIRLQLIPKTLGVITIEASFSNGKVAIAFDGGEHALFLLERHATLLRNELTLQGWNLGDTPLSFGDERSKHKGPPPDEGVPAVPVTHKSAPSGLFTRVRGIFT